jgi:hypothetical protein
MKKGTGVGIAVAIIVISIVVGVASLPDEILFESPNIEKSDNEVSTVPTSALELSPPVIIKETMEETEETMEETEEEGEVIKIKIKDGIGAGHQ